ncbi:phosphate ABC transporter substrate-binding protein [Chitinophaga agrisoli]|uniref:Phosphate ABC transporter substrate-binding protein n=1 Tax=Chitinophaga agrisoli TaxID=2607653 RepID=A0A5B2VR38_9BACT|nr:substrate-binding domain-containing protein [Chitinophaga agrisoli]KAA2240609.1 phosphate ABC transporter substrate-binding protein [Chitinophaga agrisoli]
MFLQTIKHKALLAVAAASLMTACDTGAGKQPMDTPTSGTVHISVDETYEPLIEAELKVFHSLYPKTNVIAEYKPEAECIKDLLNDSARLVIVTRELNDKEKAYFKELKISPQSMLLAWDALALVVNHENPDSILTMEQVRKIMDGSDTERKWQLVFDNENSSTVRFIRDSINKGKPLPTNTMAAKTNPEVVDYVTKNKEAIGVIGVNWISDPNDSTTIDFTNKVSVVKVRADYGSEFVMPYQAYIATGSYQMKRGCFFVLREPYRGLGTGFATFLGSYEGQLIIKKFRLFPARINAVFREASIQ